MSTGTTTRTQEITQGVVSRVRGALPRGRGVSRARGVSRVTEVLESMTGDVSPEVFTRGVKLYNKGLVHETGIPWVFRVGSDTGAGFYGHEVDLSVGSCQCRAYELRGYVCKHVVAAGMMWMEENA